MSEELKPCPFCGGEADPEGWMNGDGECGPECESCGATASSVIVWNRRAELAALKAGQGEAVGEIWAMADGKQYASLLTEHMNSQHLVGAKLYTAPPASADARLVPVDMPERWEDRLTRMHPTIQAGCWPKRWVDDAKDYELGQLRALLAQSESEG